MTDWNPRPDQEPTPPAPTGWSQDPGDEDDELPPPFLPGAARPGAGETRPARPEEPASSPGHAEESAPAPLPFQADPTGQEGAAAGTEEDDDFPFDAFDIEGGAEPVAMETVEEGGSAAAGAAATHELADRLEAMARRLRAEGSVAAESDMSSSDRFTALLAGLLAGYLAGRE